MRARRLAGLLIVGWSAIGTAQSTRLTRDEAVRSALARGARGPVARADTNAARAQLLSASVLPNPALSLSYSKSAPLYHLIADVPFDYPIVRRTRMQAAEAGLRAANYRLAATEALIALDADTSYTRALAAQARLALSERNARDADSLRRIATIRRDAGDASDLDVEIASIYAGQQANAALNDSLTLSSALLDLQAIIGLPTDRLSVSLADTLALPSDGGAATGTTLPIAAAAAALESADVASRLQRRSWWSMPSLAFGFDYFDDTDPGLLPTIGIAFGVPLFDRNRGGMAVAEAERVRARAELALAETESRASIAHAERELTNARARVQRDQAVVASANRVATLSLSAYREGAASLSSVLEAQRNVRDVLRDYINDVADAATAAAVVRILSQPAPPSGSK